MSSSLPFLARNSDQLKNLIGIQRLWFSIKLHLLFHWDSHLFEELWLFESGHFFLAPFCYLFLQKRYFSLYNFSRITIYEIHYLIWAKIIKNTEKITILVAYIAQCSCGLSDDFYVIFLQQFHQLLRQFAIRTFFPSSVGFCYLRYCFRRFGNNRVWFVIQELQENIVHRKLWIICKMPIKIVILVDRGICWAVKNLPPTIEMLPSMDIFSILPKVSSILTMSVSSSLFSTFLSLTCRNRSIRLSIFSLVSPWTIIRNRLEIPLIFKKFIFRLFFNYVGVKRKQSNICIFYANAETKRFETIGK